jgi:hypothetical protein
MISIAPVDTKNASYVRLAAERGSVFNQAPWLSIYGSGFQVCGIFNANQELIGAFNIMRGSKARMKYILVPPFSPSCALFYVNPAEGPAARNSFAKEVHTAIADFLESQKALLRMLSFPVSETDMQPYFWKGFKVIPNYTYLIPLEREEDALFAAMSAERRKSVRKALKDGLTVERCYDFTVLRELVLKTFERKSRSLNTKLMDAIFGAFGISDSFAFLARVNGVPSACVFCIHYNGVSYYLFGGYDSGNRHHGAGPLCMWEAIKHARNSGIKTFDLEGSMLPEVERYFRDFGGELVPYYTIQKGALPVEMALKLSMRNRF